MPTYGIMHDDGTFEPLNQQQVQQQIPQPNWRYRPANIYGNRVIAGMQHPNGPRYGGTQVRTMGGNYQQQLPAGAPYSLSNNLYYGSGAPVAQRWYGGNPNVSTVYGGYGYNAPQSNAVAIGQGAPIRNQQVASRTSRSIPRITQRGLKQRVGIPEGVIYPFADTGMNYVYPQPQLPSGVAYPSPETGMVYNNPQPAYAYHNQNLNYYSPSSTGELGRYGNYVPFSRAQQAISESWERPISRHPALYGSRDLSKNAGLTMGLRQPRDEYEAQLFGDSARLGQTQLDVVKNAWNTVKNWFAQNPRYEQLKMSESDFNTRLQDMDRAVNWGASNGGEIISDGNVTSLNTSVNGQVPVQVQNSSFTLGRSELREPKSDLDPFTYVPLENVQSAWSDAAENIALQVAKEKGGDDFDGMYEHVYNNVMQRLDREINDTDSVFVDNGNYHVKFSPGETPESITLNLINKIGREHLGKDWTYIPK